MNKINKNYENYSLKIATVDVWIIMSKLFYITDVSIRILWNEELLVVNIVVGHVLIIFGSIIGKRFTWKAYNTE